jgi:phage terminase Nu1 subunit (DNA packaging protein)
MTERLQISMNQRQLADLLRVLPERISQATNRGIIHRVDGSTDYDLDTAVGEWLEYERGLYAKGGKKSEFERQRARLTKAKAEVAERKLAMLDRALVTSGDIIERTKAVCLRIKSKLQTALPRIARGCYYAPNLTEALFKVRAEFDLLIAELSALEAGEARHPEFEVVASDEDGAQAAAESSTKSPERSTAGEDPSGGVS